MFTRRPLPRLVAGILALALVVSAAHVTFAQKGGSGGGGPVPAGTIYFKSDGIAQSMKADGSGKAGCTSGSASYQLHGTRWFLQTRYWDYEEHGTDELGTPVYWSVYDVVAVNETGRVVPLGTCRGFDIGYCKWGKGDSFISFTTAVDTNGVVTGGLVVVPLTWVNDVPVAGQPIPALQSQATVYGDVNLFGHDWSATGDRAVFQSYDEVGNWQLCVADFSGVEASVQHLAAGVQPDWSAVNGLIAYGREVFLAGDWSLEVWTVKADGTSASRVTQSTATTSSRRFQGSPSWSPDGTLIAFTDVFTKGNKTTRNILRVAATGGTATALTSDGKSTSPQWR